MGLLKQLTLLDLSIKCKSALVDFSESLTMVEVTLEKVNHGKLKFTMVNGTASVTPNLPW